MVRKLETVNAAVEASKPRSDEDEQPRSVIHAPQGFDAFVRQSMRAGTRSRRLTCKAPTITPFDTALDSYTISKIGCNHSLTTRGWRRPGNRQSWVRRPVIVALTSSAEVIAQPGLSPTVADLCCPCTGLVGYASRSNTGRSRGGSSRA